AFFPALTALVHVESAHWLREFQQNSLPLRRRRSRFSRVAPLQFVRICRYASTKYFATQSFFCRLENCQSRFDLRNQAFRGAEPRGNANPYCSLVWCRALPN